RSSRAPSRASSSSRLQGERETEMAANPADFDLGPLSWVKTEIDHSLNQARENLDKLAANAADRAPVKYVLTHLHQATGALAMVGLGAATRFNEELEKLAALLETLDAGGVPAAVASAKKGMSALSAYLDTLLGGQPDHPMRLLAPYLDVNRARGASDATEGDLFYPNLAVELPAAQAAAALDDAVLAKALAHQRSQYQQGLLRLLKGGDTAEALRQMHAAVAAIESLRARRPRGRRGARRAAARDARDGGAAEGYVAQVHVGQSRGPRGLRQAGARPRRARRAARQPGGDARPHAARGSRARAEGGRDSALGGAGARGRDRNPLPRVGARELFQARRGLLAPGEDRGRTA